MVHGLSAIARCVNSMLSSWQGLQIATTLFMRLIFIHHCFRLESRLSKHYKFWMRLGQDLVPPRIIYGNQFTMISQHQVAAKEYLQAYKQMPENPLVNLCAGMCCIILFQPLCVCELYNCVLAQFSLFFPPTFFNDYLVSSMCLSCFLFVWWWFG